MIKVNWKHEIKKGDYTKNQRDAFKKLMNSNDMYFMGAQDLYYLSEYLQKAKKNNTISEDVEKELNELLNDLENVQNKLENTLIDIVRLIGKGGTGLYSPPLSSEPAGELGF